MGKISIKVNLAGRIYPVTVNADEEEQVREAAAKVEDSIKRMQESFAVKDKQDLLAMTALQMSKGWMDAERSQKSGVAEEDLDDMEKLIDSMLNG